MMMTSGAAPCLSCGTEGGYVNGRCLRPMRRRGLCHRCEVRADAQGIILRYPDCGAVPVPLHFSVEPEKTHHPTYPGRTLPDFVVKVDGQYHPHALHFRPTYSIAATEQAAEDFAAAWLASHPAYEAKWCQQEAVAA